MSAPIRQEDFIQSVGELGDRIFFDTDRFNVDPADQAVLQTQAQWLARYPNARVTLEGHAHSRALGAGVVVVQGDAAAIVQSAERAAGAGESGAKQDAGVKAKIDAIEQQMVGDGFGAPPVSRRGPDFYNAPTQPTPRAGRRSLSCRTSAGPAWSWPGPACGARTGTGPSRPCARNAGRTA